MINDHGAVENLARVLEDTERYFDNCLTSDEWLAAAGAVVAYLTSDEAMERATEAHWAAVAFGGGSRAGARAAILAALGVESLPLDPEPWTDGTEARSEYRSGSWDVFEPRPGYEQHREFYEKGGKR